MIKPIKNFSNFAYAYFYNARKQKLNGDWLQDYSVLYDIWHLVWSLMMFFACIMKLSVNLMWKWNLSFLGLEQITTMTCGGKISKSAKFDYRSMYAKYWTEVGNIVKQSERPANLHAKFSDDWFAGYDCGFKGIRPT